MFLLGLWVFDFPGDVSYRLRRSASVNDSWHLRSATFRADSARVDEEGREEGKEGSGGGGRKKGGKERMNDA